jgi:hypothetical protein
MCEISGFTRVRAVPMTLGIVYLYVGERRNEPHEPLTPPVGNPVLI